jgi:processive 1,2-diacylglycerol beta-glucosyltransferase
LGIPFDQKFNAPLDRIKLYQKFKLDPWVPTVLIMGGGQGLGPIKNIIRSLETVRVDLQEIVVCGTNKKLYKSLKRKIKKFKKKILLFAYADNMPELMWMSDFIVTKPGGVTTAEVLAQGLPMIIVKPIPGQEVNNTIYLTQKDAAIQIDRSKEINRVVEDLFANPYKLQLMSEAGSRISKPDASMDIARLLLSL